MSDGPLGPGPVFGGGVDAVSKGGGLNGLVKEIMGLAPPGPAGVTIGVLPTVPAPDVGVTCWVMGAGAGVFAPEPERAPTAPNPPIPSPPATSAAVASVPSAGAGAAKAPTGSGPGNAAGNGPASGTGAPGAGGSTPPGNRTQFSATGGNGGPNAGACGVCTA